MNRSTVDAHAGIGEVDKGEPLQGVQRVDQGFGIASMAAARSAALGRLYRRVVSRRR